MKRFSVIYWEQYASIYEVNAESYEEACEKVEEAIANGNIEGPMLCVDSGFEGSGEYDELLDYDEVRKDGK